MAKGDRPIVIGTAEEKPESVVDRVTRNLAEKYPTQSPIEALASLSKEERDAWLGTLTPDQAAILEFDWNFTARPNQRNPRNNKWKMLILLAGRGYGKTRTASEIVRDWAESGKKKHIALVGCSAGDVRDTMVEPIFKQGSGIMQICPPWNMPHYSPTKRSVIWNNPNYPSNGAVLSLYSGDQPDQLRGPSHDGAWIDEICKMRYAETVLNMLKFTMRRGDNPQTIISTTPKPVQVLIDLLKQAEESKADGTNDIVVIKGSTYENRANLSSEFLKDIREQYEGTSLGRQEIYADVVLGSEGALWSMDMIDQYRIRMNRDGTLLLPSFGRTVIGVDPQTGYRMDSDMSVKTTRSTLTGIIPVASSIPVRGQNLHAYVLADDSVNGKPDVWGNAVVRSYRRHDAVLVCAERNQGGLMIESIIRGIDPTVKVYLLTAVGKKHERAIPVVTKYEQGRVHHIGVLPELEQEQILYEPGDEDKKKSPNRMDAAVHGIRHLLVDGKRAGAGISITRRI